MFDPKSDFALNKLDREAIVCKSVTGVHTRLTCEDFTSKEEFEEWKEWSDSDYKKTESKGRDFYDNCISLNDALDSSKLSVEDILMLPFLEQEHYERRMSTIQQIKNALTEKQYRRLCLYYLDGLTEAQIAKIEGVGQRRVSTSISSGIAALKKILKNF